MEIEILSVAGSKPVGKVNVSETATIKDVKERIYKNIKKYLYPERQSIKLEVKGRSLKDDATLKSLNIENGAKLYLQDLGPQISWKNVFLAEYAGPLFVYLWAYQRPWILYGEQTTSPGSVSTIAAICWSIHYAKRILETLFVHRFSHGTMPLRNLFKNCSYYWMFALYIAYHINHPLYTAPCDTCVYIGLTGFTDQWDLSTFENNESKKNCNCVQVLNTPFICVNLATVDPVQIMTHCTCTYFFCSICELGNLSIHILLKNLRPPGTKVRRIPVPDSNPFSKLFDFVSCPNYTYEFGSWLFFTILTKCAPAGIFGIVGLYQMSVWALGKHRNYKKEFPDYPKGRKAIIPFIL